MASKPVNFVRWHDAARFVNWLSNGQPEGIADESTTETGTYNLGGLARVVYYNEPRGDGIWALSSGSEFVKAGFYNGITNVYYPFATQTGLNPEYGVGNLTSALSSGDYLFPGVNRVNYASLANWNGSTFGNVTTVGSCGEESQSPWGTFDQNGNVGEWTQQILCIADMCGRAIRGGWYSSAPAGVTEDGWPIVNGLRLNFAPSSTLDPDWSYAPPEEYYAPFVGFRVVRLN